MGNGVVLRALEWILGRVGGFGVLDGVSPKLVFIHFSARCLRFLFNYSVASSVSSWASLAHFSIWGACPKASANRLSSSYLVLSFFGSIYGGLEVEILYFI